MSTMRPRSLLDELDKLESLREPEKAGQRQFRRFVVRGEAELHPMNRNRLDPTPLTIQLRDISRGGVGFLCDQARWLGHTPLVMQPLVNTFGQLTNGRCPSSD